MRKKNLLFIFLFMMYLSNSVHLFCKSSKLGIKAGISNAWTGFSGDLPGIQLKSINEFSGGVFLNFGFGSGRWGIQPEIHYFTKGFDARENYLNQEISSKYKITYYEIPLLVYYRLFSVKKFEPLLLLGPYIAFPGKVREVQTIDGQTEKRELGDNLKKMDAGMVFGLDIRYRFKKFCLVLAARYHWGMTNISRDLQAVSYDLDRNDSIKNRSFSLMFGVAFSLSPRK